MLGFMVNNIMAVLMKMHDDGFSNWWLNNLLITLASKNSRCLIGLRFCSNMLEVCTRVQLKPQPSGRSIVLQRPQSSSTYAPI
ncbi:hypothetical protein AQUCO_08300003v1 [Aquilegia coerulea]|uniref:Uncharacterized protein n=1 Tax=Aquilegia coerulea TaxID=218851 RepID=A0A2G5C6V1_AQUCA|nr:hypothetical protein AQUCO_08300003v1 [Aquilegia coerulea]